MNYAMRWFYKTLAGGEEDIGPHLCAVCGLPTGHDADLGKVLRDTFTDRDVLEVPWSGYVCAACEWYFDHQELRRQHWYLTAREARPLAKADIFPLLVKHLRCPPAEDRYYFIAQSKKKHVALRARLNAAGCTKLRVNFETIMVDVDQSFPTLMKNLVALRKYHSWDEIESDRYLPYAILKWPSFKAFEEARWAVAPYLRSPQWQLARFLYSPDLLKGDDDDGDGLSE
jgi:hypothetical protein